MSSNFLIPVKPLRLQEARRLIIGENLDAAASQMDGSRVPETSHTFLNPKHFKVFSTFSFLRFYKIASDIIGIPCEGVIKKQLEKIIVLFLFLVSAFSLKQSEAAVGDLYAVTGSGCDLSTLYQLNPANGATIATIGPVDISSGATQLRHVTGLAIHPSTGVLYALVNDSDFGDAVCDFGVATLITIDKTTGDATVIGSTGLQSPDIAFDPFGTLYAWDEGGDADPDNSSDNLWTVNLTTGAATKVGECFCSTSQTGLAISSDGVFFMKDGNVLNRLNPGTGTIVSFLSLDDFPSNPTAFNQNDVLFTVQRNSSGGPSTSFTLQTINVTSGDVTDLGTNAIANLSGIAFDRGVITPPTRADLSVTKTTDAENPTAGTDVTFTVTIQNDGPGSATNVEVTDLLPSGYQYVSDDAGGDYDSGTGVWTVGTVANASSESIEIVATVLASGDHENVAEVTATDGFDPDSVPADNIETEDDQAQLNVVLNGAVELIVHGRTRAAASKKGFQVKITNVGLESFSLNISDLLVEVNSSTDFVTCTLRATTVKPGSSARAHCSFNPSAAGVSPGDSVEYSATLEFAADVSQANNTDSETQIAE